MAPLPQPPRELAYAPLLEVGTDETFRIRPSGEVASLAQSIAQVGQLFAIDVRRKDGALQPITGFRRLKALRLLHRSRVLIRDHGEIPDELAALVAAADAIDTRALEAEELREMHERYAAMGWGTPALQELIARAIERADERLEDLAAQLRGETPPDRGVEDEDERPDDDDGALLSLRAIEARGAAAVPVRRDEPRAIEAHGTATVPVEREEPAVPANQVAPAQAIARPPADPPGMPRIGPTAIPAVTPHPFTADTGHPAPREVTAPTLARDVAERLSELTQDLAVLADHWREVPVDLRGILSDQLIYYSRLGSWLARNTGEEA